MCPDAPPTGKPFDLNAVHPHQARAAVSGAAGDVPVLFDARVGERGVGRFRIHGENPTGIALDARCAPGLVVGHRRVRGRVP